MNNENNNKDKKPLILIVDDVPKNIQVLGSILSNEKYQIAAAVNGRHAVEMVNDIKPDLILLDIMMPELDGFEVCKILKASEKTKHIPIIFLTAKTATEDIVKGFQIGAVDYVTKPFNSTELLARTHTHLELKRARDIQDELIAKLKKKTEEISRANSRLHKAYYQLRKRQNVIVTLLGDISKIRFSGDRHAIRNFVQRIFENEKNSLVQAISKQIFLIYQLIKQDELSGTYLTEVCTPFGITADILENRFMIENKLHQVVIERINSNQESDLNSKTDENKEMDNFLGSIFSEEVSFDKAYHHFLEARKSHCSADSPLAEFDPFVLFFSLRSLMDITAEINKRFSEYGKMEFLDNVSFSECLRIAGHQAVTEKEFPLQIVEDLKYNPTLNTNKDAMIHMLRDIFYNAIDAGANKVTVASKRPSKEEDLPHYDKYTFEDYPSLYISIEDNGEGISADKAMQLNNYLNGNSESENNLSVKGGLGTKNLRDFLYLHKGRCHYESCGNNTRVHIYFEKLEI
ncbi:MAG: response regulator [Desulfobacteraceae bacterium]|nr:response regulator [Desulfobacteraceae bacterium]